MCLIYSWKKLKLRKVTYISQCHTLLQWFTIELNQRPVGIAIPCSMDHANLPPFITILIDGGNTGLELVIWSNLLIVQMRPWEIRWFMQQISGDGQTRDHTQYVLSPVKMLRTMMSAVPSYQSYPTETPPRPHAHTHKQTSMCLILLHWRFLCMGECFSQTELDIQVNHVGIWLKYRFWFRKPCKFQNILEEFKNKIK